MKGKHLIEKIGHREESSVAKNFFRDLDVWKDDWRNKNKCGSCGCWNSSTEELARTIQCKTKHTVWKKLLIIINKMLILYDK